jgi:DNA-binding transcriptional MerR regulator
MTNSTGQSKFTASDIRAVGGISYRQLNDWDSKGALPNHRAKRLGWRKFDPKEFFVVLVCAEFRKQFGVSIEQLAWLQKFMLQDGANHFSAALKMMQHGLAVLILTDLSTQFDMDADVAIGDYLSMGLCRSEKPQSHLLLLVNPIINKMLKALKQPMQLRISDAPYQALDAAQTAIRARDTTELEMLKLMRQPDFSKITAMRMPGEEVWFYVEERPESEANIDRKQIPAVLEKGGHTEQSSRRSLRKVPKVDIELLVARMKE